MTPSLPALTIISALSMLSTLGAPTQNSGTDDVGMYDHNGRYVDLRAAMSMLSQLSDDSVVPNSEMSTDSNPTDYSVDEVNARRRDVGGAIAGLTEDELKSNITAQLEFCQRLTKDLDQLAVDRVLARCEKTSNTDMKEELRDLYGTVAKCSIALLTPDDRKKEIAVKGDLNADKLLADVLEHCLADQIPLTIMEILGEIAMWLSAFVAVIGGLYCIFRCADRVDRGLPCFPWCDHEKIHAGAAAVWGLLDRRSQQALSEAQA